MNAFVKMFRSLTSNSSIDTGFEAYYGSLVRKTPQGGPSAAEARRDFRAVRASLDRATLL